MSHVTRDTYLCVFPPINCAGALQVARTIYTINLTICDYASGNDLQSAAGMEERSRRVGVGLCMHLSIVATPDGEVCFTPVFTMRSVTHTTHICTLVRAIPITAVNRGVSDKL